MCFCFCLNFITLVFHESLFKRITRELIHNIWGTWCLSNILKSLFRFIGLLIEIDIFIITLTILGIFSIGPYGLLFIRWVIRPIGQWRSFHLAGDKIVVWAWSMERLRRPFSLTLLEYQILFESSCLSYRVGSSLQKCDLGALNTS